MGFLGEFIRRVLDRFPLLPLSIVGKSGGGAGSGFDYSGPFTETVLLGTIAARVPGKLLWDSKRLRFTNSKPANAYVRREYRKGWDIDAI